MNDTTEAYIIARLPEVKARIAELRRQRQHVSAGIMRDEALCQLEQWLDPIGIDHRAVLQTEQRACAGELALAIDPHLGF
jgi:hypothetical protein